MTVGEYIDELIKRIEQLQEYDDNEQLTAIQDDTGEITYIVGDTECYTESLN